jgi:hypothetical protein
MTKKGQLLQNGYSDLLKNCRVGRSWHAEHVCSLNLTSIFYSFWNEGQKVLKFRKFDEKRAITQINFKIAGYVDLDMLHIFAI